MVRVVDALTPVLISSASPSTTNHILAVLESVVGGMTEDCAKARVLKDPIDSLSPATSGAISVICEALRLRTKFGPAPVPDEIANILLATRVEPLRIEIAALLLAPALLVRTMRPESSLAVTPGMEALITAIHAAIELRPSVA